VERGRGGPEPVRCPWPGVGVGRPDPRYVAYHDTEWGRAVRDEVGLFEKLSLEAFQSGLAWITILRKRDAFRSAFAGFAPERVATFGAAEVERLMADTGIVRNRRKIEATIANARALLGSDRTLTDLVWAHQPAPRPAPRTVDEVPATVPESAALARELRRRGFRFVGPTTMYALMQACGLVDDHLADCWVRGAEEHS